MSTNDVISRNFDEFYYFVVSAYLQHIVRYRKKTLNTLARISAYLQHMSCRVRHRKTMLNTLARTILRGEKQILQQLAAKTSSTWQKVCTNNSEYQPTGAFAKTISTLSWKNDLSICKHYRTTLTWSDTRCRARCIQRVHSRQFVAPAELDCLYEKVANATGTRWNIEHKHQWNAPAQK